MYDGIKAYQTGEELIAAPEVQAVVITSSDPSHAGYVLESLKHGKYVFWKPPSRPATANCWYRLRRAVEKRPCWWSASCA